MPVLRPAGRRVARLALGAALAAMACVASASAQSPAPQGAKADPKAPAPDSIRGFWKFGSVVITVAEKPDARLGACYVTQPVAPSVADFDDEGRLAIQIASELISQRNGEPTQLGKASFSGAALVRYRPGGDGRIEFIAKGAGFSGGAEHFFDSAFEIREFSATLNGGLLNVQFKMAVDAFPGRCVFSVAGVYYKGLYR